MSESTKKYFVLQSSHKTLSDKHLMPITNNSNRKLKNEKNFKRFSKKMFVQGAWNYFSSFPNRIEIIPVKNFNPQYVVRIMGQFLNGRWRHCDVTELYFGFNLASLYFRNMIDYPWYHPFVRFLSDNCPFWAILTRVPA